MKQFTRCRGQIARWAPVALSIGLSLGLMACGSDTEPAIADGSAVDGTQQALASTVEPTPLSGEQLFFVCQACHSLADGAEHKVGPNLYGIINQPAASSDGYDYSDALKNSGLVWNKGSLTGWILATENVVPGTWMAYHNHLSVEETQRLVDYIVSQAD